eukprot:CAMPEP_0180580740 /NCGR_PEP_ID=MMETSP1037_2-20121125/13680_1 /TAXON_ID=632150 /ORGANISM="Azadinium spinosum, Strain 3D9" /LENGTH=62 /DNA_ID=CAMNT_0022598677 /DNA_START=64 /DNA_END=252 /DNA_ORIENTATION=-
MPEMAIHRWQSHEAQRRRGPFHRLHTPGFLREANRLQEIAVALVVAVRDGGSMEVPGRADIM